MKIFLVQTALIVFSDIPKLGINSQAGNSGTDSEELALKPSTSTFDDYNLGDDFYDEEFDDAPLYEEDTDTETESIQESPGSGSNTFQREKKGNLIL